MKLNEYNKPQQRNITPKFAARNGQLPQAFREILTQQFSNTIYIASDKKLLEKINQFRFDDYKIRFPNVEFKHFDHYDLSSYVFYSTDKHNNITSTIRLAFDGPMGLPSESYIAKYLQPYRDSGKIIAELGRFIINNKANAPVTEHYKVIYNFAIFSGMDMIVLVMKKKDLSFHKRMLNITVLADDIGDPYGAGQNYAIALWDLNSLSERYLRWQWQLTDLRH